MADESRLQNGALVRWKNQLNEKIMKILKIEFLLSPNVLSDDKARIKLIFSDKMKGKSHEKIYNPPVVSKNDNTAKYYMKNGTNFDQNNNFDLSHDSYTRGIVNAKSETSVLSALYLKRSKIFYTHELFNDCLADSERALKSSLLDKSINDFLIILMANCHQELSKWSLLYSTKFFRHLQMSEYMYLSDKLHKSNKWLANSNYRYKWDLRTEPSLITVHEVLPDALTDALKVEFTEELGRHVTATRDIEPGEILCVENAYAITVNQELKYNICSYCKSQTWSSIPCEKCIQVIYCSIKCRDSAYNEYHDIECVVVPQLLAYGIRDKFLLALRLTIIGMKEMDNSIDAMQCKISNIDQYKSVEIFNKFNNNELSKSKYDSIYITAPKYSPHLMKYQSIASCVIIAYFYGIKLKLFEQENLEALANDEKFLFLVQLIETNMRIATFNSCNMSMLLVNRESIKVSKAIFASFNLFPHSCRKMIAHSLYNDKIFIRSICSIKKGEQIFNNYDLFYDDFNKEERKGLLKHLNYICKCKVCVDDVKILPIEKSCVSEKDLENFRSEIECFKKHMDDWRTYLGEQFIVNTFLPRQLQEAENILELFKANEKYLSCDEKEADECIKLYLEIIAWEQVPYVTLQNIREAILKLL